MGQCPISSRDERRDENCFELQGGDYYRRHVSYAFEYCMMLRGAKYNSGLLQPHSNAPFTVQDKEWPCVGR